MWAKVQHPSGSTIRGNLHAKKSSNYLRVVLQIFSRTSHLVSCSQSLRYLVGAVITLKCAFEFRVSFHAAFADVDSLHLLIVARPETHYLAYNKQRYV